MSTYDYKVETNAIRANVEDLKLRARVVRREAEETATKLERHANELTRRADNIDTMCTFAETP